MIEISLLVYIMKKFRHDIIDKICHWIILFVFRYCMYVELQTELSVDSLSSLSSSSYSTTNITSLKRRLIYNIMNEVSSQSSSTNQSSKSSQTVPLDSRIESEANRLCQQILLDSDFESLHKSEDIGISSSSSSILDTSSVNTRLDSNPGGVVLEDKSTQVRDQD